MASHSVLLNMNSRVTPVTRAKEKKARSPAWCTLDPIGNIFCYVSRVSDCVPRYSVYQMSHPLNPAELIDVDVTVYVDSPNQIVNCSRCKDLSHDYTRCTIGKPQCQLCGQSGHGIMKSPNNNVLAFRGGKDPLSNFYMCDLEHEGQVFTSSEHMYQWMKAIHHDQPELADQILRAEFPYEAKKLGDEINENLDIWDDMKVQVMTHVLNMKYLQCAQFRDTLHHSNDNIVAEATNNMFWASGLNPQQTIKTDRKDWPGKNALGCLLMALRSSQLRDSLPKQPTYPAAVALLDRAIDPRSGVLSSPELLSQADDVIKQLHDTPTTARPSLLTSSQMKRKDCASPKSDT